MAHSSRSAADGPADTLPSRIRSALARRRTSDCNADDNFWRSPSNLTLNVDLPSTVPDYAPPALDAFGAGCANGAEFWAASQAAPIRRAIINGTVIAQDYCSNDNYASGGFLADSEITGDLQTYGNQQYVVRNSEVGGAPGCNTGGLWNNVFSGVEGAPAPVFTGQCAQNTVLATSPVTEEEPFLYSDSNGRYRVFVPAVQHNTTGPSWASGSEAGMSMPFSRFFVATPSTPVLAINAALAHGKNLILAPGVYDLKQPSVASRPDTVVLGLGFATLVPQDGNAAMIVAVNKGVKLSGVIIDAGPVNSRVLLSVGVPGAGGGTAADPDTIQDVFFRSAGPRARLCRQISACFLVTSNVKTFNGYGMGSYVEFIDTSARLFDAEAFRAPDTPGVQFHNIFRVWIAGSGGDQSIINGTGGPVTSTNPGTVEPVDITSYP